jgi:hypothetical protein
MTDVPDFRGDKSDTTEGRRVAAGRWSSFHYRLDEDVVAEAFPAPSQSMEELPAAIRDDIASDAVERSELIGFWVAWHLAGGFANLERGGWHRATIFRKVSRFRAAYGAHPDTYVFPWIQLDLDAAWSDQIASRLELTSPDELSG